MGNRRDLIVTAWPLQTLIPSVSGLPPRICPLAAATPTLFGDSRVAPGPGLVPRTGPRRIHSCEASVGVILDRPLGAGRE